MTCCNGGGRSVLRPVNKPEDPRKYERSQCMRADADFALPLKNAINACQQELVTADVTAAVGFVRRWIPRVSTASLDDGGAYCGGLARTNTYRLGLFCSRT